MRQELTDGGKGTSETIAINAVHRPLRIARGNVIQSLTHPSAGEGETENCDANRLVSQVLSPFQSMEVPDGDRIIK